MSIKLIKNTCGGYGCALADFAGLCLRKLFMKIVIIIKIMIIINLRSTRHRMCSSIN